MTTRVVDRKGERVVVKVVDQGKVWYKVWAELPDQAICLAWKETLWEAREMLWGYG